MNLNVDKDTGWLRVDIVWKIGNILIQHIYWKNSL